MAHARVAKRGYGLEIAVVETLKAAHDALMTVAAERLRMMGISGLSVKN